MSTVATMRPAATIFREEQYFDWRVYTLIAALELLAGYCLVYLTRHWGPVAVLLAHRWSLEFNIGLLICLALPLVLAVWLLQMTTEVTPTEVRVWFGWVPIYRRVVSITGIQTFHVVQYRPILDYGGWGIRTGRDGEPQLLRRETGRAQCRFCAGPGGWQPGGLRLHAECCHQIAFDPRP